jgi:nicotinic acid mononucleotide adenylyltransferase
MQFGVFVGRLCPPHAGHEVVVRKMVEDCGAGNCLVVIGSDNSPMSLRHFFSYEERRGFLKAIFPEVRVVGLADFPTDGEWLTALDDLIRLAGSSSEDAVFYGGCEEDVAYFVGYGRKVSILNRFDGTTPKVSATEVRDALIHGRSLDGLLNPQLAEAVAKTFRHKWEIFKRM